MKLCSTLSFYAAIRNIILILLAASACSVILLQDFCYAELGSLVKGNVGGYSIFSVNKLNIA